MEEEFAVETDTGGNATNEAESSEDVPNDSPIKRGRGRPVGSKKPKVCVSDGDPPRGRGRPKLSGTKLTEKDDLGDGQNGDSAVKPRGRGRPKGSKKVNSEKGDHSPKKRGRPKKSLSQSSDDKPPDLPNGGTESRKRGRPKGSGVKRKLDGDESGGGSGSPKKRGRPKGSVSKKPKLDLSDEDDEVLDSSQSGRGRRPKAANGVSIARRGRGRPRKDGGSQLAGGSLAIKRGRGRPKGSSNKKPSVYKAHSKVGRPRKLPVQAARGKKRGRPRLNPLPAKRGRPRKYPLPSPEELKKPKVWKPLGRPRKYPRVDPPEGAQPAPRRSRGRPRKSDSKKGAHLRKNVAGGAKPYDGPPRKRGRPKKSDDDTPQKKRGRPKGSVNKPRSEEEPDAAVPNHAEETSDSPASAEEVVQKEDLTESAEHRAGSAAENVTDQDASCDVGARA